MQLILYHEHVKTEWEKKEERKHEGIVWYLFEKLKTMNEKGRQGQKSNRVIVTVISIASCRLGKGFVLSQIILYHEHVKTEWGKKEERKHEGTVWSLFEK